MAIFKAVVHSEYAQIPNSTLQDSEISFEARGVLAMLLSMPDSWEVHKSWVVSQSKAGRDKVSSIFKELENAGYIRKEEGQRKFGKFSSDDYFIFPTKCTSTDLPQRSSRNGSAVNGESDTIKETSLKNKQEETKQLISIKYQFDFEKLGWPEKPDIDLYQDWLKMRKKVKASVTERALKTIGKQLTIAVQNGFTVNECLEAAEAAGWKGFKAEYMKRPSQQLAAHQPQQSLNDVLNRAF
jgi:hypothetical protein